ncbi:hypothetical protein PsorP6_011617 [Peronosclerospora sorghi]|uniref:Uncharacterized protein n=1 Tax=Peronosclerospora sorghi TaxID=230839 RepID=A0ACC0WJL1_9STRA|nr:hypothetical protein PsorP6_011617 [Peronosclerospora sorghi]
MIIQTTKGSPDPKSNRFAFSHFGGVSRISMECRIGFKNHTRQGRSRVGFLLCLFCMLDSIPINTILTLEKLICN